MKCEFKNYCGYCQQSSCKSTGGCNSPCPDGLDGEFCQTKTCTNMKATMCHNNGILIYKY